MQEKFLKFIADIFEVETSAISMETAYGSIEAWDSLMQLRLVSEINDEYDVEIPIDEVANIKTLADFYKYVESAKQ